MLNLARPGWLWALPLVVALWWWMSQRPGGLAAQVEPWRRRASAALRLLSLSSLLLVLAGLRWRQPAEQLSITLLIDQSLSTRRQQGWIQQQVEQILAARPAQVQVGVVYFAGDAALELAPSPKPYLPQSTVRLQREETDLASAMQYASACQPPDRGGRIVLISDGRQTRGQALEAARGLALEVDTLALPSNSSPEVALLELRSPPRVSKSTPFDLVATVQSSRSVKGAELSLSRNGRATGRFTVDLEPGRNVFLLPQAGPPLDQGGLLSFEARISAAQDGERANNRAQSLSLLQGPPRIALLQPPGASLALAQQWRAQGLRVEVLGPGQFPEDPAEWLGYQALVLNNLPSTDLSSTQLDSLRALVGEAGLGLLMLGGPNSFAAGGYSQTPLSEVLPVDLRVPRSLLTAPTVQLHILDKSGSMGQVTRGVEHMAMAREASIAALELLSPEDIFGVIGFDDAFKWVVPLQPVSRPKALAGRIASLRAGGGTDLFPALEAGLKAVVASPLASRHILVLSDGATAPADFDRLLKGARKKRVVISTVAVGEGADLQFLRRIAAQSQGRCYVADQARALPRIFARETLLASRSAFDERPAAVEASGPHPVLQGLGPLPPLLGHNLVTPRGTPQRVLLQTPKGDPILALGRYGLGKTVAFSGDAGERWSRPWASRLPLGPPGSELAQVLLQSLRWALPQGPVGGMEVSTSLDRLGRLEVEVRAAPELAPQGLQASLVGPEGRSQSLELIQVSPDRYRVVSDFEGSGTFILTVASPDGRLRSSQPLALQRPQELSGLEVEEPLLRAIAEASGGRFQPTPAQVFRRPRRAPTFYRELSSWLLAATLLLLWLEVACRRLHWPFGSRAAKVSPIPQSNLPKGRKVQVQRRRLELPLSPDPPAAPLSPPPEASVLEQLRQKRRQRSK